MPSVPQLWKRRRRYLIDDEFRDIRAAGAVDGTPSTPGRTERDSADTGSDLEIVRGAAVITGGTGLWGDPYVGYDLAFTRVAGRFFVVQATPADNVNRFAVAWQDALAGGINRWEDAIYQVNALLRITGNNASPEIAVITTVANTTYTLACILRANGSYWFGKGGTWADWRYLGTIQDSAVTPLYVVVSGNSALFDTNFVRVPDTLWLPTPLAYSGYPLVSVVDQAGINDLQVGDTTGTTGIGVAISAVVGPDGSSRAMKFERGGQSYITLGNATFASWFDPDEGMLLAFGRVNTAAAWADTSTWRYTVHPKSASDATKYLILGRNSTANTWVWRRRDSGGIRQWTLASGGTLTWHSQAITYSVTAGETKTFYDGVKTGITGGIAAMTVADFNDPNTLIGAGGIGAQYWHGDISNVVIGKVCPTEANVLTIHNGIVAGTLTTADLDTIFGAGNWIWYKLDDEWPTETTGPDAQPAIAVAQDNRTFVVRDGKVLNVPSLGTEKVVDPGLEGNYTAGLNDNLLAAGAPNVAQSATVHGGAKAQQFQATAASDQVYQNPASVQTIGMWYEASIWGVRSAGAAGQCYPAIYDGATYHYMDALAGAAYAQTRRVFRSKVTGSHRFRLAVNFGAGPYDTVIVDDFSLKELTLPELFTSVDVGVSDVCLSVDIDTWDGESPVGVVLSLDDEATPANFVIAYLDRDPGTGTVYNGRLEKCVAGTYTTLVDAAITFSAGASLFVAKDGTSYAMYYNNIQVGATQTIADAGIISNTRHGLFSTSDDNQLDNLLIYPRGTKNEYSALNKWSRPRP